MKLNEIVKFRNDLFFGGAVQLDWLENDQDKAEFASENFVFHGPEYHGIDSENELNGYKLTDTATFTENIICNILEEKKEQGISLVIAGYGTGKSHLGMTISTLLSTNNKNCKNKILENIEYADKQIADNIKKQLDEITKPFLIISLNGMKNFNLASELSRQSLNNIKQNKLPIKPLEDLWPRFHIASEFCERNFSVREDLFKELFDQSISLENIKESLKEHNEDIFEKINKIYYQIVGTYINAMGQESPQELLKTLSNEYCGSQGFYKGILILFDEFGRYLEFAAEKPQAAGDAAIQQLFEAVQNNLDKSFLLCFNQYELRTYLSRIASDLQITLQRYITRFDSAKKYYLSSNLETLFAHLIEKKDPGFITSYLGQPLFKSVFIRKQSLVSNGFNIKSKNHTWKDNQLFNRIIVQGCWPLDPLATWMLSNLNDILQNRSSIAIIKAALDDIEIDIDQNNIKTLSATDIADYGLIDEFIANEKNGYTGSDAELYIMIKNKISHNLSPTELSVLLSILIANKLKAVFQLENDVRSFLASLCNLDIIDVDSSIKKLVNEFGVIEWNSTQNKYDYILDAVPRSKFLSFLSQNVNKISKEQINNIFVSNAKDWSRILPVKSSFSNIKNISTTEWEYVVKTTNLSYLKNDIKNSYYEWLQSFSPENKRGTVIYCFISEMTSDKNVLKIIEDEIKSLCNDNKTPIELFPFYVVPIHDDEGIYAKCLSEYFILTGNIDPENKYRFKHFIEDHKSYLKDELPKIFNELKRKSNYLFFHPSIQNTFSQIGTRQIPIELFSKIYSLAFSFMFDGFNTTRGNAAKDCREIAVSLINSQISSSWLKSKNTQLQNRFNTLLSDGPDSWQVIDSKGDVRLYPLNQSVKEIIKKLETRIEQEKEIPLINIINEWIKPPYGLNTASASILLGVFLAPRTNSINILFNNNIISRINWLENIFDKNFLNLKSLKYSRLKYIEESETSAWNKLLEEWETSEKYSDKIIFEKKSEELITQIGNPSEGLYHKMLLMIERNQEARDEILKKNNELNTIEEDYVIAKEYIKADKIIFAANKANNIINEMKQNVSRWNTFEIEPFILFISKAEKLILEIFENWLDRLYLGNISQLVEFEKKHHKISRILKELGHSKQSILLDNKIQSLTTKLNKQKNITLLLNTINNFQNNHYYTENTSFQEIEIISKKAKAFIDDLKDKIKNDTDNKALAIKIEELTKEFISAGNMLKNKHISNLSKYYDKEKFENNEEVLSARDELEHLKAVYIGKNEDLEEINSMLYQINLFQEGIDFIEENIKILSLNQIEENIRFLSEEFDKKVGKDAEIIWDYQKTVFPIFQQKKKYIEELSSIWIKNNAIDEPLIKNLPAIECRSLLRNISNSPQYLVDADKSLISKWNLLLVNRLSETKIDGVVVMFDELEYEQKNDCFEILKRKMVVSGHFKTGQ